MKTKDFLKSAAFFGFFFLVITAFWTLKPLRTSGVIKAFGPDLYPLFKTGSVVVLGLVVPLYSWLASRVRSSVRISRSVWPGASGAKSRGAYLAQFTVS